MKNFAKVTLAVLMASVISISSLCRPEAEAEVVEPEVDQAPVAADHQVVQAVVRAVWVQEAAVQAGQVAWEVRPAA